LPACSLSQRAGWLAKDASMRLGTELYILISIQDSIPTVRSVSLDKDKILLKYRSRLREFILETCPGYIWHEVQAMNVRELENEIVRIVGSGNDRGCTWWSLQTEYITV
jgi:hypothetical protein